MYMTEYELLLLEFILCVEVTVSNFKIIYILMALSLI